MTCFNCETATQTENKQVPGVHISYSELHRKCANFNMITVVYPSFESLKSLVSSWFFFCKGLLRRVPLESQTTNLPSVDFITIESQISAPDKELLDKHHKGELRAVTQVGMVRTRGARGYATSYHLCNSWNRVVNGDMCHHKEWIPGDSKWPFRPLVGGHLTIWTGRLTIPKRSQRIARYWYLCCHFQYRNLWF